MLDNVEGNKPLGNAQDNQRLGDILGRVKGAASPPVADDVKEHPAVAFLMAFDPSGWHHLDYFIPDSPAPSGKTFKPGDRAGLDAFIKEYDGRANIYFVVNEPVPGAPDKALTKEDIASIRAVYADRDLEPHEPRDRGKARLADLANRFNAKLPATYTLDSGGGIQLFWLLKEKIPASANQEWAENQGRGLADWIGGDDVGNINRFMRLPFTQNMPDAKKRCRGRIQAEARILSRHDVAYTPAELSQAVPPVLKSAADLSGAVAEAAADMDLGEAVQCESLDALPGDLSQRLATARAKNPLLDVLLRDGAAAVKPGKDASASGLRASLVFHLSRAGFGAQDYACIIHAWPPGWPSKDGFDGLNERTLSRDWARCSVPEDNLERFHEEVAGAEASALSPPKGENAMADGTPARSAEVEWIRPAEWEGQPEREPEWVVQDWIPHGHVSLLYGEGGTGKTLLAQQLATAIATGKRWLEMPVRPGRVMCIFCEDDRDELHRRQNAINRALGITHSDLGNMLLTSRVGDDNILATFDGNGLMKVQPFFDRVLAQALEFGADLIIVDTLADTSGAKEMDRGQVNAFMKTCLGRLARGITGSVLALGHPSQSGKQSGDGTSGSTAWSNAARGRIYMTDLKGNMRQLENKKSNYGPKGSKLKIEWQAGAFGLVAATPAGSAAGDLSEFPTLEAADEDAVVRAVAECPAVRMTLAGTTVYAAPKVLMARCPEILKGRTPTDVKDALIRLVQSGIVEAVEIGRDNSSRPIKGLAINQDKLSAAAAAKTSSDIFD